MVGALGAAYHRLFLIAGTVMNKTCITACCIALFAAAGSAIAQTAAAPADPMIGNPTVQRSSSGVAYIHGGAGDEERKVMDTRRAEFPLKLVLSAGTGEYIVADTLTLSTPRGEVLVVRDAGPVIMIKAPPGAYTVEAVYQGVTQRRAVKAGRAPTVSIRFPG